MNTSAFWEHVDRSAGPNACWPWTGAHINDGYGQLRIGRTRILAHRLAYMIAVADIPDGAMVLHSCDNPNCCNPAHLRTGSNRDNMRDARARGRTRSRVFSSGQAAAIRSAAEQGATIKQIAAVYGVHYKSIHRIVTGRAYREATA